MRKPALLLFCLILLTAAPGILHAQDGGTPCQPDLSPIYPILARAQVAFESGDSETGLAALDEARALLEQITTDCGSTAPTLPEPVTGAAAAAPEVTFPALDENGQRAWTDPENSRAYHVENTSGERRFIELPNAWVSDFTLEVETRVEPGYVAGAALGIAFRGAPGFGANFYHWRISTNGAIIVYANTQHGPRGAMQSYSPSANAVDWLDTPAYQREMNAVNHLKVVCEELRCLFFINDQQVMATQDARLTEGGIALVTEGYLHVVFENFTLTTSGPVTAPPPPEPVTPASADVTISPAGFQSCGGWPTYVVLQVDNATDMVFESASATITDASTGATIYGPARNDRPFTSAETCPPGVETLEAHSTAYLKYNVSSALPGSTLEASIRLCSGNEMQGTCLTRTARFSLDQESD